MAPKALLLLPLLAPFTVAWGSTHDLYIRDAIPELNYEQALAARAIAARKAYAAKVRRSASPQQKVLLSRQINARAPKARASAQPHAFQQYDAGLFSRDGSVLPRDPYAYPTAVAQPDPETWFEGGELWARMQQDDDDWEDEEEKTRKKSGKKGRKGRKGSKSPKNKSRKGKTAKKESEEEKEKEDDKAKEDDKEDKESKEKKFRKSWFSWFKW